MIGTIPNRMSYKALCDARNGMNSVLYQTEGKRKSTRMLSIATLEYNQAMLQLKSSHSLCLAFKKQAHTEAKKNQSLHYKPLKVWVLPEASTKDVPRR